MNPPTLLENQPELDGVQTDRRPGLGDFEIDFIEEMRLRTWARRNHVPAAERDEDWHVVVLDEMARIDRETALA